MSPNEIKVTVTGLAGSGKSAVAHAIQVFLKAYGLEVAYEDPDCVNTEERTDCVLDSLYQRGTKITIVHEQGRRNA